MEMEPIQRLTTDIAKASTDLSSTEARFLVDAYYQMQDNRIRAGGQIRSMDNEPHAVLGWLFEQNRVLESQVKRALSRYAEGDRIGQWAMSQVGIGPVIAAGLLAHIDITRAKTAGAIWNFAGLNPNIEWKKGQKRPFNAALKVLCWKIGESFVKVVNKDDAFYGKLYAERKELEIARNDAGDFKDQATAKLEKFKIGKTTDAYKSYSIGKLPPGHIHARAKRYAVKMFLSHYHEVAWRETYGEAPPVPYVIAHGGHTHYIPPPGY